MSKQLADGRRLIEPFSDTQIVDVVAPYLDQALPVSNPTAATLVLQAKRQARRTTITLGARQFLFMKRNRSPAGVMLDYDGLYQKGVETLERGLARDSKPHPFMFGNDLLLMMRSAGVYSAYLSALAASIETLQPKSVREIGFGSGKNLFYLAHRFNDIEFSGFELTPQGTALAQALQKGAELPENLSYLVARDGAPTMERLKRIAFEQGDASRLPAQDKSVDLTFTMLALEQMWPILPRALTEIRRTTRKYAVFIEAFRDANDFSGQLHLFVRNYFRASLEEMENAGFRPLQLVTTLPRKFTFSAAMLIAEVV